MEYTPADISRMRGLMNPTAGDKQQALAQLLTQLGAGLLQGGAPQATPGGGALGFARGAQLGTQAYGQTIDAARKRNLGGLQMQMALDAEARRAAAEGRAVESHEASKAAAARALQRQQTMDTYVQMGGKDLAGRPVEPPGDLGIYKYQKILDRIAAKPEKPFPVKLKSTGENIMILPKDFNPALHGEPSKQFAEKTDPNVVLNYKYAMEQRKDEGLAAIPFTTWLDDRERAKWGAYPNTNLPAILGGAEPPAAQSPAVQVPAASAVPAAQAVPAAVPPAASKPKFVPGSPAARAQDAIDLRRRQAAKTLPPAAHEIDKAFAKEYTDFVAMGGFGDAAKNINQMQGVVKALRSGDDDLTGWFVGNVPDFLQSVFTPKAKQVRSAVEEVVQRNLRVILGAQFTEREGVRLIARAFDPTMGERFNADRLSRLVGAMEMAFNAKKAAADYYEEHGTLVGYKGTTRMSLADIEEAAFGSASDVEPVDKSVLDRALKQYRNAIPMKKTGEAG